MNEDNKQGIRIAIERLTVLAKEFEAEEYEIIAVRGKGDIVAYGRTVGACLCIAELMKLLEET